MIDPEIQKLLIVQDRDRKLSLATTTLEAIPRERKAIDADLKTQAEALDAARGEVRKMEVERESLENEVETLEESIRRYKRQQMEVKKNEEYTALTHEIERTQAQVSALEEKEIELLMAIDDAKSALAEKEAKINERVARLHRQLEQISAREAQLQADLAGAEAAYESSRDDVAREFLEAYDRVRKITRNFPYVAEIIDHKCSGCHLKVSGETFSDALTHGTVHYCDQCARIVYRS